MVGVATSARRKRMKQSTGTSQTGFIWFWGSVIAGAVAVYLFKAPVAWVFTVIIGLAASFVWDKFCKLADDIGAMRRLFEAVVNTFVTVRMDEQHGFTFVMDVLAETLRNDPELRSGQ
jgi:hypothetical protein